MVNVVVEGCCHGDLDPIYQNIPSLTDILVICGDFEAIRNTTDLETMSVPKKYSKMGDFHKYYSGEKKAPVLTVFVGGNHECLLYLRELQYGGWVAPNIYYLGHFGTVWFKGLRISGISGIWNHHSFVSSMSGQVSPNYSLPYTPLTIKSIYHVLPKNYLKLLVSLTSDIVVSHDWPQYVWEWGNIAQLLRHKPYFRKDIESGRLGSPLARNALARLKPGHWFSLHLHTRFAASVRHAGVEKDTRHIHRARNGFKSQQQLYSDKLSKVNLDFDLSQPPSDEISLDIDSLERKVTNSSEIALDFDSEVKLDIVLDVKLKPDPEIELDIDSGLKEVPQGSSEIFLDLEDTSNQGKTARLALPETDREQKRRRTESSSTQFLALDKCLPGRKYIELVPIEPSTEHISSSDTNLYYDARAIAVNKVIEDFVQNNYSQWISINPHDLLHLDRIKHLLDELEESVALEISKIDKLDLKVPINFKKIAPDSSNKRVPLQYWPNNQTQDYCQTFGVQIPDLDGI